MYWVYILKSQKTGRHYTDHTDDLENRLNQHNAGEVKSTKSGIPWKRVFSKPFSTRAEAMRFEKKSQSLCNNQFFNDHLMIYQP